MVKQKFSEKQIKSNKLKRQVNSLQNKINSYEDLIESLKNKQLSENAANQLQVSLCSFLCFDYEKRLFV